MNDDFEHNTNNKECIDITASQELDDAMDVDEGIENETIGNWSEYTANEDILCNPHHSNSMDYAKSRSGKPPDSLECYYVCPAQHEHREVVITIESKDYAKVCSKDEYLNDVLIEFQLKYIYASWPAAFKQTVFVFNSFFWKKLSKLHTKTEGVGYRQEIAATVARLIDEQRPIHERWRNKYEKETKEMMRKKIRAKMENGRKQSVQMEARSTREKELEEDSNGKEEKEDVVEQGDTANNFEGYQSSSCTLT